MILQRLVEYYDRLARDRESAVLLPKPGYSLQKVSFCVVLEPDGTLQQFQSLLDAGGKRPLPRQLLVPGQAKPTGMGINPGFLWDNSAYLLGFKPDDPKPERTRASFEAFRERHLSLEPHVRSGAFRAVCAFLRGWSPETAASCAAELTDVVGNFGVFKIAGETGFVHDDTEVVDHWAAAQRDEPDGVHGRCLVTGSYEPIARVHEPKIKGVRDAQSSGASLVSFNEDAYTSFLKEQSYNAPVGVTAAFKYANALNYLLGRADRRMFLGDTTVVFWAEQPTPVEDFVSELWGDSPPPSEDAPAEDKRRAEQVRLFLSQLREGRESTEAIDPGDRTRFYILGLAPNAARISVRFWVDTTIGELKERLRRHMSDVALVGARDSDPPLLVRRIVDATGRAETDAKGRVKSYDRDVIPKPLGAALVRAIATGAPYPLALLSAMIGRLRADGAITHPRIAAIKGCITRNRRLLGNLVEVPVGLDTQRAEPAYVTGRLFAILEKIQRDSADGELNSTIKDRYFSSASATPGVVFPRLIRLSQHHLAKLETGRRIYHDKQLGEVMDKLDGFSPHFGLEDQGLFAVGYFHQKQAFYRKKDEGDNE